MDGMLDRCNNTGCGFKCCDFGQDGHIVAFPNELEGKDTKHLKVIGETEFGTQKLRCFAKDRKTCDGGYKPIQCRIYPLWIGKVPMRSSKCPLQNKYLSEHAEYALDLVNSYHEEITAFKKNVFVDKYIPFYPKIEILNRSLQSEIISIEFKHVNNPKECLRSDDNDIMNCLNSGCSVGIFDGEKLIAFSLCYFNEYGVGYVEKCFVLPGKRGNGYQFKMLEVNRALLKIKGVHTIYAMVSPINLASIKGFERAGFVNFKKLICEGVDRIIMKHEADS